MPRRRVLPPPRPNPAWSNELLARNWRALERLVGPARMPTLAASTPAPRVLEHPLLPFRVGEVLPPAPRRVVAREFGTGVYGVVLPTHTPGLVLKLTTDPGEARFAVVALTLSPQVEGVVRYDAAVRIDGTRRGATVYALWREEAFDVERAFGHAIPSVLRRYQQDAKEVWDYVAKGRRGTSESRASEVWRRFTARDYDPTGRPAERAAYRLTLAQRWAEEMSSTERTDLIGAALLDYLRLGVLVVDVHNGNVGMAKGARVITDPGQALFFDPRLAALPIPTLSEGQVRWGQTG